MARHPDPTTRFYRACDPNESFGPSDPRYVVCDEARGGVNVVERLEKDLRRADPDRPLVKQFAGHRGVGKSSELLRLKELLERPFSSQKDSTFQVVYFDVSKALDVNDLDFPDLLVCTAAEVQRQLRDAEIPGFDPITAKLQSVWDDLRNTLVSKVLIKDAKIGVPFGELTTELKNRPNARSKLRDEIELRSSDLLGAVNDLLTTATVKLLDQGKNGLVVIIDGLDKIPRRDLNEGKTNTHDRLFIDRSDQLAGLAAHTIYTVPISLFYSSRTEQMEESFGEPNVPVSMINLRGAGRSDPTPDTTGMQALWALIEARCKYAEVEIAQVFDTPETGHYLCRMTGGHPRHLMMFLRSALSAINRLPITRAAAESAVRNDANSLLRAVADEYWEPLRAFAAPRDDIPKGKLYQDMLYYLYIFEYMNGAPWYEVNPVIRDLPKFAAGR